jgi:hypothetical protein
VAILQEDGRLGPGLAQEGEESDEEEMDVDRETVEETK